MTYGEQVGTLLSTLSYLVIVYSVCGGIPAFRQRTKEPHRAVCVSVGTYCVCGIEFCMILKYLHHFFNDVSRKFASETNTLKC